MDKQKKLDKLFLKDLESVWGKTASEKFQKLGKNRSEIFQNNSKDLEKLMNLEEFTRIRMTWEKLKIWDEFKSFEKI